MAATNTPEGSTATRERPTTSPLDQHAPPTTTQAGHSGRATASMVLGIISIPAALFAILGLIIGIVGLTLGLIARGEINRKGLTNRGQAVAGIVCSSIGIVLAIANAVAGAIIATS
jgi:hypothetical protein